MLSRFAQEAKQLPRDGAATADGLVAECLDVVPARDQTHIGTKSALARIRLDHKVVLEPPIQLAVASVLERGTRL